ncbi:MAG: response regulator transcription factor [Bacteroidales bacterium]|nr:MAG: response regulator transcription factor [Bacteroidales bacterium]
MKLRCVIVDDEPLSIEVMEGYLKKIPNIEVVATFNDAISVMSILSEQDIDFLFLDIEMPKLSGIDFLRSISNPPMVIITSANKNYALDGYELNVVDYLLKPITLERVIRAVNKIIEKKSKKTIKPTPQEGTDYIFLKENKKMIRLVLSDIQYIESIKDYVKVVTENKTVVTKQNLSHFEQILDPSEFVRVHRSFIVAIRHIDAFTSASVEIGKLEIPIGRLYKDEALKRLGNFDDTKIP